MSVQKGSMSRESLPRFFHTSFSGFLPSLFFHPQIIFWYSRYSDDCTTHSLRHRNTTWCPRAISCFSINRKHVNDFKNTNWIQLKRLESQLNGSLIHLPTLYSSIYCIVILEYRLDNRDYLFSSKKALFKNDINRYFLSTGYHFKRAVSDK